MTSAVPNRNSHRQSRLAADDGGGGGVGEEATTAQWREQRIVSLSQSSVSNRPEAVVAGDGDREVVDGGATGHR